MTKQHAVICITGPESSGKSTLAIELASNLKAVILKEYAREYLNDLPDAAKYTSRDLEIIAQVQLEKLKQTLIQKRPIVLDTGVEVVKVWHEEKFGPSHLLNDLLESQQSLISHYILCTPDMPWEPDPLRENPNDRGRLFKLYENLLVTSQAHYKIVKGPASERVSEALDFSKAINL